MSTQFNVDMYKNDQVTRRYSEGFKLKVLAELSSGKYSKRQLSMIYGLQCSTINGWIKKYDRKDLIKAVSKTKQSLTAICSCFDLKRDAYYKYLKRFKKRESVKAQVLEMVRTERKEQPRVGGGKLHMALQPSFKASGLKIGRDSLFDILREHDMLIRRKKATCRTTYSHHRFYTYKNLVKDMEVTRPNQVWVSDITYVRTVSGFCYLALITDMYSRKIVGYDLSDSLELAGGPRGLQKNPKGAPPGPPVG